MPAALHESTDPERENQYKADFEGTKREGREHHRRIPVGAPPAGDELHEGKKKADAKQRKKLMRRQLSGGTTTGDEEQAATQRRECSRAPADQPEASTVNGN